LAQNSGIDEGGKQKAAAVKGAPLNTNYVREYENVTSN